MTPSSGTTSNLIETVMHKTRMAIVLCLGVALSPLWLKAEKPEKLLVLKGKVVPTAELVKKIGTRLDADAMPFWMALVTEDGKIYPLIKDNGSRMFFQDKKLLNRSMQIQGRTLPGCQLLQIRDVHSIHNGTLHELYYWCEICAIRRSEKTLCECCGGPMERIEKPLKKK